MPSTDPARHLRLWSAWRHAGEKAAHLLGLVLFTLLWIFALGPVAIVLKLRGKRLLPHFTGAEDSFYLPKEPVEPTLEAMKKQW